MRLRNYKTYSEYIDHQKRKTAMVRLGKCRELQSEWRRMILFLDMFRNTKEYLPSSGTALCLCARRGEEVAALRILGLEAKGIDLIEFPPFVEEGDVHNLRFPDSSCDFIYSNAFDHILKPDVVASEIDRVLKPSGVLMLHLSVGVWSDEMSCGIDSEQDVIDLFPSMTVLSDQKMPHCDSGINYLLVLRKK